MNPDTIDLAILATCAGEKSVSPSDVAEALMPGGHWQSLLPKVKERAIAMMLDGRLEILRKGKPVTDPAAVRGVIRLRAKN
ncbi:MAG: DUF3253 domain-containing protein [Alphaproteobacteria bacterium]|nr:DUF3253 domain-containing protein [Alphaproteobacteria bacterium]